MLKTKYNVLIILIVATSGLYAGQLRLRNYTFPPYGEIARRARIEGSVMVEVSVSEGRVSKVEFLSNKLTSPIYPVAEEQVGPPRGGLAEVITNSISNWVFEPDTLDETFKFRLNIIFRLMKTKGIEGNRIYRFSIQESEGIPTEIIIEAETPSILY
jgi:hypothetical protein